MRLFKMRYIASLMLVLLCLINANSMAQDIDPKVELTPEEIAWIKEHPVITSTNEMEWAPLDFVDDGEAIGFSIDYLNLVASKVGLKIEYVNGYAWDVLLAKLEAKEIDMAQSIIKTPDREVYLNFTDPYLNLPMVYFGREGADRINSIEDLKGKRIGVVIESISDRIYTEDYSHLNIIKFDSTVEALKALSAGAIDIHADILPVSRYMIRTNLLPGIEVVGDKFFPETENADLIRLAARKDWPELNSIKFTGDDGYVECNVSANRNGNIVVDIKDNGIGIPSDRIDKVLNPFEQVHADSDLNEEGTGLGLSIVQKLVELHNGKFKLESEYGLGTTASITIPSNRISY